MRRTQFLFTLSLLLATSGCSPSRARISGTVTIDGKILPAGLVTFSPANPAEEKVIVELTDQGRFNVELPIGEVKVCVDNREWETRTLPPAEAPPGAPPDMAARFANAKPRVIQARKGTYLAIPSKYYAIDTTDIVFVVSPKEPVHDIALKK